MRTLADHWFEITEIAGLVFLVIAILMQLTYSIRLQSQKDRSEKYKFASKNEVKSLNRSTNVFAIAIFFFAFNVVAGWLGLAQMYQYIFVAFISFMISFVIGYGLWAYLKYYYPFRLEKRLKKIRFKPLKSPKSGKSLRLLNEHEEDEHMTEEMIAMEDALEADFDIWIDDESGEKIVQKYDIAEHMLVCPNCGFRTLKERSEEVILEPTETEDGKMERNYKCTYCGWVELKEARIPSWSEKRQLEKV
jgi:preprotein translocase subunit SecG